VVVAVRAKCHAHALSGIMCDELLHRFILMGDGIGAEYLLADVRLVAVAHAVSVVFITGMPLCAGC
jgi:hypothetical protein